MKRLWIIKAFAVCCIIFILFGTAINKDHKPVQTCMYDERDTITSIIYVDEKGNIYPPVIIPDSTIKNLIYQQYGVRTGVHKTSKGHGENLTE